MSPLDGLPEGNNAKIRLLALDCQGETKLAPLPFDPGGEQPPGKTD